MLNSWNITFLLSSVPLNSSSCHSYWRLYSSLITPVLLTTLLSQYLSNLTYFKNEVYLLHRRVNIVSFLAIRITVKHLWLFWDKLSLSSLSYENTISSCGLNHESHNMSQLLICKAFQRMTAEKTFLSSSIFHLLCS